MQDLRQKCRVAVVQMAPVMFDKEATLKKCVELIKEAGKGKADLIVLPELIIPCYPFGMTFGFTVGSRKEAGREDWKRYYDGSIVVPGKETEVLGKAAKKAKAYVSIGVSERDAVSGTLYNSNIIFAPDGSIAALHRKLKPTGSERVVWGDADRAYFPVVQSPWGPIGNLICWESNTNDNPEWQATIQHIALEGRCYYINCDQFFTREMYPPDLKASDEVAKLPEIVCRGGSCIIDPYGHYVTEPVWDKEEIIYADLDMDKVPASRMEFDACGHYSRPDVLKLVVEDK